MSQAAWRDEDESILQRLEDEVLLDAVWALSTGGRGEAPHPRAAGLVPLLRARGVPSDPRAFAAALEVEVVAGLPPALLHHMALFHGRVADALEVDLPDHASAPRLRSLGAWIALAAEGSYLTDLATVMVSGALPARDLERAVSETPIEQIDELGRRAESGAPELSASSRAALRVLARIDQALAMSRAPAPLAARVKSRSDSRRTAAIEAALGPIADELEEVEASGDATARFGPVLARAVPVWVHSEYDEQVETFVVTRITDVAWEVYSAARWDALRALLLPFEPLVDSLEARILRDPSRIAYAASCAQMLVFRSELQPTTELQIAIVERALRVHPTHRNGRLLLAGYLCDLAARELDALRTPKGWLQPGAIERASAYLERAEKVYPQSRKLESTKEKLEGARRGWGAR